MTLGCGIIGLFRRRLGTHVLRVTSRMDVRVGLNIERFIEDHCRINRVLQIVLRCHTYSWRVCVACGQQEIPDN